MNETIEAIVKELRSGHAPDARWVDRLLREANRRTHDAKRTIAKKRLLPYFLHERASRSAVYLSWGTDDALDDAVIALLRAKPRRTASGVATVTVLTKPWPCGGDCIYCPSDIRMPKSYLSDEPACQRAERCGFDPYLQVTSRLHVLADMGHNVDKVELIVLGGTWSDYPEAYRRWFVKEALRALNEFDPLQARPAAGQEALPDADDAWLQAQVNAGALGYNEAVRRRDTWSAGAQQCTIEELREQQRMNEDAACRNVGLVVETRPDVVTDEHLDDLRGLGCTKIQLGVQSLRPDILAQNTRAGSVDDVRRALALVRAHGFKSHVHFMVNLLGATPSIDKGDFLRLVRDPAFMPDEIKLYPCALVESARLMREYEAGRWAPYTEDELVDVLSFCLANTPPFTRISRMIRDISSKDIVCGNKKTNLRQLVEQRVSADVSQVQEMRMREIATDEVDPDNLQLDVVAYETSNTTELFMQYVTAEGGLAAFLRLSLPHAGTVAMIREVHVYGKVARLHGAREGAQHAGLGRNLVEAAKTQAASRGFLSMKVISAIGTRNYYRSLGFEDGVLYQELSLDAEDSRA